jgi:hypothetical protein
VTSLPTLSALSPRSVDDIAATAQAVQANVVALRVAWCRRSGQSPNDHDIKTPAPGSVHRVRELLIDHRIIKDYSFEEIVIRLRQVWGEFSALCWLFPHVDPQKPIIFEPLDANQHIRCCADIQNKLQEVQAGLWRIRHEQRVRHDPTIKNEVGFQREHEIALSRPMMVYQVAISVCSDEDLFCCACEYAGMLAALRWATDNRWSWEAPGIMDVVLSDGTTA